MIQDYVITVVNLSFIVALLPSIFSKSKPHRGTCAITSAGLLILSITFFTLNLWFSSTTAGIMSALWFTLLVQRRHI